MQSLVASVNDITVHCHVNQRDVCVFLSVCPDSVDMTFDVPPPFPEIDIVGAMVIV